MTDTPPTTPLDPPPPPPPPQPQPPRRLTRSGDDRMIAGVAGGLGRHFDLDPVLFRIGFVVLTLFGGSGLLLYILLALIVPTDGAERDGTRQTPARTLLVVAAAIVAAAIALPGAFFLSPFILVAAIGVLIYRAAGGHVDPRTVRVSVIVVAVLGAIALGFGAAVAVAFGAGTIVAGLVAAAGVALVVASFFGGARWLIAPALILAIPVALVAAADINLEGGVGDRDYRPATVADVRGEYRLGVGEMRIDLRDVEFPAGTTTVRTDVGIGHTEILLPEAICLESEVHMGMGAVRVLGRRNEGIDVDASRSEDAPSGAPVVRIEAETGVGEVDVHRGERFFFVGDDEGEECASA